MIAWTPLNSSLQVRSRFFVSYRSLQRSLAEAVQARLVAAGQDVWRDRTDINTADDWRREIRQALDDCDDVVVLLTPDAARSEQVLNEIEISVALGKRIHCFTTFQVQDAPEVYRHINAINVESIPQTTVQSLTLDPVSAACYIVGSMLKSSLKPHPLGLRDFERRATRNICPEFSAITNRGRLDNPLTERYCEFARQLVADPARCTAAIALNAGILSAHLGQWRAAQSYLSASLRLQTTAIGLYFKALATLGGIRPRHLGGVAIDDCVVLVRQCWQRQKSPLIALLMIVVLWDSGNWRGDNITNLCAEAMNVLPAVESDRAEISRFLALIPFERGV
jgi:hypothetical protein